MNERSIFLDAVAVAEPVGRAAFLESVCAGNPELRLRIERLLEAHFASSAFMASPAAGEATAEYLSIEERPGMKIGPYKLLQQIGEGGMGVVFMAEQEEPVRRKVALKIIKPGMDSKQVIARFEAERQALSMMDHPNIARVLDAGATSSGRPFFVMELVHGVPIIAFCDANKLSTKDRLGLFVSVCQAIQHAHMKGIIHRDIKPSNLLVTMYDDKPVPKVIDFGVAKAVEQRLTEKTMFTQYGTLVGTFEYMSPEQAEMNAFGVDTRSDVYSLGVLLYELLTGTTPLDRKVLRQAALGEVIRMIKEDEAPRPSIRLSSSGALPKVAELRQTDPAKLASMMKGELDWIVMRCLEKDRTRRYDTAIGLARDVERFLKGDTVEACPPTLGYRIKKAYRKNRVAVRVSAFLAGTILFFLVGITIASIVVAHKFEEQATEAKELAQKERTTAESERKAKEIAAQERAEAIRQGQEAIRQKQEADRQTVRQYVETANRLAADGDISASLLWNVKAVETLEANGDSAEGIRTHLNRLFQEAPVPVFALFPKGQTKTFHIDPQGRTIALVMESGEVHLHDLQRGQRLSTLPPAGYIFHSEFSPDGKRFLTVSGQRVDWSQIGNRPRGEIDESHKPYLIRTFDVASGKTLAGNIPSDHSLTMRIVGTYMYAYFCRGGQQVIAPSSPTTFKLYDAMSGNEMGTVFETAQGQVELNGIRPDGNMLLFRVTEDPAARSNPLFRVVDLESKRRWSPEENAEEESQSGLRSRNDVARLSPNGRIIVVRHGETISLYDQSEKPIWRWNSTGGQYYSSVFSPDSRIFVYRDSRGTHAVNTAFPNRKAVELGSSISSFWDIGPGGRILLAGTSDRPAVFDTTTGRIISQFPPEVSQYNSELSPDGQYLLSGEGNLVRLFRTQSGLRAFPSLPHESPVSQYRFTPDGSRVVTLTGTCLRVWPLASEGSSARTLPGYKRTATNTNLTNFGGGTTIESMDPDGSQILTGKLLSDKDGIQLELWDAGSGTRRFEPAILDTTHRSKLAPGKRVIASSFTVSQSGTQYLIRLACQAISEAGNGGMVGGGRGGPGARGGPNGDYYLYWTLDGATGRAVEWPVIPPATRVGRFEPTTSMDWNPAGRSLLRVTKYSEIPGGGLRFDAEPAQPPKSEPELPESTLALYRPDGSPVGEPIRFRDLAATAWSPDGRQLAVLEQTESGLRASLWENRDDLPLTKVRDLPPLFDPKSTTTKETIELGRRYNNFIASAAIAFSADSDRVAFSFIADNPFRGGGRPGFDQFVRIWDRKTDRIFGPDDRLEKVAGFSRFSPDGNTFYANAEILQNRGVVAIDASNGRRIRSMIPSEEAMRGFAVHPDGRRILTWGMKKLQLWDAQAGELLSASLANDKSLLSVKFSADGKRVIASLYYEGNQSVSVEGMGNDIRIWDAETGQTLLPGVGDSISVSCDVNGRTILQVKPSGEIALYELKPDRRPASDLRRTAEVLAGRRVSGGGLVVMDAARLAESWTAAAADRSSARKSATDGAWHEMEIQRLQGARKIEGSFRLNSIGIVAYRWHLDRYLLLRPEDREKRIIRSKLAFEDRDWAQVLEDLRDEPGQPLRDENLDNRGNAHAALGHWEAARDDFRVYGEFLDRPGTAGSRTPTGPGVGTIAIKVINLSNRALVELKLGRSAEFRAILAEMGQLRTADPENRGPRALFNLYALEILVRDMPLDGIRSERQRLSKVPSEIQILSSQFGLLPLAEALDYREGKFQAAAEALEKAYRSKSGGTIAECLFLAMAAQKIGKKQLAKEALDRADDLLKQAERDPELLMPRTDSTFRAIQEPWRMRVAFDALRQEAEELVRGKMP